MVVSDTPEPRGWRPLSCCPVVLEGAAAAAPPRQVRSVTPRGRGASHLGLPQDRTGDAEQLPLPHGEVAPARRHLRLQLPRQLRDL